MYQAFVFCSATLAEVDAPTEISRDQLAELSYSAQYDRLFQQLSQLDTKKVCTPSLWICQSSAASLQRFCAPAHALLFGLQD